MAAEGEVALGRLETLSCGKASTLDREWHAEHWTLTLLDFLQRGRIGRLERRPDGPGGVRLRR